jgi:hypothetical protein
MAANVPAVPSELETSGSVELREAVFTVCEIPAPAPMSKECVALTRPEQARRLTFRRKRVHVNVTRGLQPRGDAARLASAAPTIIS